MGGGRGCTVSVAQDTGRKLRVDPTNGHVVRDADAARLWSRRYAAIGSHPGSGGSAPPGTISSPIHSSASHSSRNTMMS